MSTTSATRFCLWRVTGCRCSTLSCRTPYPAKGACSRWLRISPGSGTRASWREEDRPAPQGTGALPPDYLLAHAFFATEPGGSLSLATEELVQKYEKPISPPTHGRMAPLRAAIRGPMPRLTIWFEVLMST